MESGDQLESDLVLSKVDDAVENVVAGERMPSTTGRIDSDDTEEGGVRQSSVKE